MWFFTHFMMESANAALSLGVIADNEVNQQQEGKLMMYFLEVNHLIGTYVADDFISEAESEVGIFRQSGG